MRAILSATFASVDDDLNLSVVRDGEVIPIPTGSGGGGGGFDPDEDIVLSAGKGLVLTSPDGTKTARFFLDNDGDFAREDVGGGGPDPVAGIDPMTVGSLSWYLDAQSLTGLSNGDSIQTFDDRGPNNWDGFGGAAFVNPPLYATSGLNGHPAARFVRASDHRIGGINAQVGAVTPCTFIYVMQGNDFTLQSRWLNSSGGGIAIRRLTDGRVDIAKQGEARVGLSTNPLTSGSPHIVTFNIAPSGWSIFVDGIAQGSGPNAVTWGPAT